MHRQMAIIGRGFIARRIVDLLRISAPAEPVNARLLYDLKDAAGWANADVDCPKETYRRYLATIASAEQQQAALSTEALTIADYERAIESHNALVRELDVLLNGDNAAPQASLCDLVAQLKADRDMDEAESALNLDEYLLTTQNMVEQLVKATKE